MPYPYDPVKLKQWCDEVDASYRTDPKPWHQYDAIIMNAVSDYNIWLRGKAGYPGLDWMMVRAQAWVETGANSRFWNGDVLQVGKPGDPGRNDYLTKPAAKLFMLPQYKPFLNATNREARSHTEHPRGRWLPLVPRGTLRHRGCSR